MEPLSPTPQPSIASFSIVASLQRDFKIALLDPCLGLPPLRQPAGSGRQAGVDR